MTGGTSRWTQGLRVSGSSHSTRYILFNISYTRNDRQAEVRRASTGGYWVGTYLTTNLVFDL